MLVKQDRQKKKKKKLIIMFVKVISSIMFSYKSLIEKFMDSSFYLIGYFQRQRNHVLKSVRTNLLFSIKKIK